MKVRLIRKHANRIDDIDLSDRKVGDILDLPARQAHVILAEQWALLERRVKSLQSLHRRRADADRTLHTMRSGVRGGRPLAIR